MGRFICPKLSFLSLQMPTRTGSVGSGVVRSVEAHAGAAGPSGLSSSSLEAPTVTLRVIQMERTIMASRTSGDQISTLLAQDSSVQLERQSALSGAET